MEKRRSARGLVMPPLEASTGAMKNVVVPAPQAPLPEAAAGTAAASGTGTETGNGIETESGTASETETAIETGTETGTGTGTGTERALSAVSDLGWWESDFR